MINFSSLTDPIVFCCLLLSAMKLQASTHCLISGAAWAKLLYKLAVLVTSILSTRWYKKTHITVSNNTEWGRRSQQRWATDGSRQAVPLPLFVKHHFAARLFQDIFLCSLHQTEGAAAPLPYAIHLRCGLTLIHQRGHAQEARYHFQEDLKKV